MNSFTKLAFSIKKKESSNLLKALGLSGAALAGGGLGLALHNSMLGTEALEQAAALNKARRQYAGIVEDITREFEEGKAMNKALPNKNIDYDSPTLDEALFLNSLKSVGKGVQSAKVNAAPAIFSPDNLTQRQRIQLYQDLADGRK
jgi:hypothetical protein